MKDKIIVLGSSGLIGHQVYNYLKDSDSYELYNFSYRNKIQDDTILLDARDEKIFIDKINIWTVIIFSNFVFKNYNVTHIFL